MRETAAIYRPDWEPDLIRALRDRLGLTNADLASLIGVSSKSLAVHIKGRGKRYSRPTLMKLDALERHVTHETGLPTIEWIASQEVVEKLWSEEPS